MTQKPPPLKSLLRTCWLVLAIGFLLNLVWENAQAPLYKSYTGFTSHFWACFVASVVDALVTLLLFVLFAQFTHTLCWRYRVTSWRPLLLIIAGGVIAVWFEKWALEHGAWAYTDAMPMTPILQVGLLPVLQLMLLPYVTFRASCQVAHLEPGQ